MSANEDLRQAIEAVAPYRLIAYWAAGIALPVAIGMNVYNHLKHGMEINWFLISTVSALLVFALAGEIVRRRRRRGEEAA